MRAAIPLRRLRPRNDRLLGPPGLAAGHAAGRAADRMAKPEEGLADAGTFLMDGEGAFAAGAEPPR